MQMPTFNRRQILSNSAVGALGISLADILAMKAASANTKGATTGFGRAKSCIVLFCWGGMSHLDTWDMKHRGDRNIRGEFQPVPTATTGIHLCQHMPKIGAHTDKMAIVRSVHHLASDHRAAAYWNLTGHQPRIISAPAIPPSREDWPSLGAMVNFVHQQRQRKGGSLPGAVSIPYPIADRGLVNGQFSGMLGTSHDPVMVKPKGGKPFDGVSPPTGPLDLAMNQGLSATRLDSRRSLLQQFDRAAERLLEDEATTSTKAYREQALDMVLSPAVAAAFDVSKEPEKVRAAYGDHICGQSVLLARRLTGAGVPLATVYCSAGDLNGSKGAHWDTHGDGFNRLKRDLLPPLDQASGALLDDLAASGRFDETLVVWLTEFGRTPQLTGTGRNHFPNCYSVAFAGAGVAGGQTYGSSDKSGAAPATKPCGPEHLHATIFHALGIKTSTTFEDLQGRPNHLCHAEALPLFG